jgi:hypothetical protein
LEAVPVAVGTVEDTAIGAIAATGGLPPLDVPLAFSLKKEKNEGQREVGNAGSYKELNEGTGTGVSGR